MNCYYVLGIPQTSTIAEIKSAWRALARIHHPDFGGDQNKFIEARQAYERAIEIANKPKVCLTCNGSRNVTIAMGFTIMQMRCPVCKGTGTLR